MDKDTTTFVLNAAIKAPSSHNCQPWKFKVNEDSLEIHPNFGFAQPIVDFDDRELYISLGCAAQNISIAASQRGYMTTLVIVDKHIRIDFEKGELEPSDLYKQIEIRQMVRSVYNQQHVPKEDIEILSKIKKDNESINLHFFENGNANFDLLKEYVAKGNSVQMNDKAFKEELLNIIRFNKAEVGKHGDGLTYAVMGAPALPRFLSKPIVKAFLTPAKQNKGDMEKIDSSSHFAFFTIKNNVIDEWIHLGMALQEFLLTAHQLGVSTAFLNQPCEVRALAYEVKESMTVINNFHPVLLLRIGYAKAQPYSPRRPLEKVLY